MDSHNSSQQQLITIPETPLKSSARLYDYLAIVWRYKTFLILFVLVGMLVVIGYVMSIPYTYIATAKLMPPDKGGSGRSNFTTLIQTGGIDLFGLGGSSSGQVFTEILKSRTLADSLVERLDLEERLGLPESRIVALDELKESIGVEEAKSGVLTISFATSTPRFPSEEEEEKAKALAAEIVNEAIVILDILNREKIVTNARSSREFLERMTAIKRAERDSVSLLVAEFQKNNRAFDVDKQMEITVQSLAGIRSRIQTLEIEISAAEQEFQPNAQVIEGLKGQLAELRAQQAKIAGTDVLGMNMTNAPELARRYTQLRLDLEVATQVYTYLESQYHAEQVQEARDLPTVSVLDPAVPPEYRSAPRRGFFVTVAFFIILGAAIVLVFVIELFGQDFRRFAVDYFPRWTNRLFRIQKKLPE